MNLDPLSFALSQIHHQVNTLNLNKKNYNATIQDIQNLVSIHGTEAHRHLLRCLFSRIDFNSEGKGKESPLIAFLVKECQALLTHPDFVSLLCFGVDNPISQQKLVKSPQQLIAHISRTLHLTRVQEVLFALALLHSTVPDTVVSAENFLKQKLPDLLRSYADTEASGQVGGLQDIEIEVLHQLLSAVLHQLDKLNLPEDVKQKFSLALRKELPKGVVPVVLEPLLYPEVSDLDIDLLGPDSVNVTSQMMESSLADMLREQGCTVSASVDECKEAIRSLCPSQQALTASAVARSLGMMVSTLSPHVVNLDKERLAQELGVSIWNSANFIVAVRDLVGGNPKFFEDVTRELDHPGFVLNSRLSLVLLVRALYRGFGREKLPLDGFLKPWTNVEGQFSLVALSLRNPDVLCIGEHVSKQVQVEVLKQLPDDDKETSSWKSLELIECLLQMANMGYHQQCLEFFKRPLTLCPEVLALGLIQALPTSWTSLKAELLALLVPAFLNSHPNSGAVLQYCWQNHALSSYIRTTVMNCMAEWYLREPHEQTRLGRILDISHDIKALSLLLNASCFPFIIDLACLASRRGYLKLEKWLADKIQEHVEPFVEELVKFLRHRVPQLSGKEEAAPSTHKAQQLPPETLSTMLSALQLGLSFVKNRALHAEISRMINIGNMLLHTIRQPGLMPGPSAVGRPAAPVHPVDPLANMALGPSAVGAESNAPGTLTSVVPPATLGSLPPQALAAGPKVPLGGVPPHPGTGLIPPHASGIPGAAVPTSSRAGPVQAPANSGLLTGVGALGTLGGTNSQPPVPRVPSSQAPSAAVAAAAATGQQYGEITSFFPNSRDWGAVVERESNHMFQRLYSSDPAVKMSVSKCLALLKEYRDSNDQHKKDVCNCIVKNLFDEYRFFHSYPDMELGITAEMFGGLIEENIVMYVLLGVALRYVLEALKKPTTTNLFQFGITALEKFKTKLKEYPQYCTHVMNLANFPHFPRHLQQYVQRGVRGLEPDNAELVQQPQQLHSSALPLRQEDSSTGFSGLPAANVTSSSGSSQVLPFSGSAAPGAGSGEARTESAQAAPGGSGSASEQPIGSGGPTKHNITTANIDILLEGVQTDVSMPSELVRDKISFIFNNLSKANLPEKAREMRDLIWPDYLEYLSQYLLTRRVATETNFHPLYNNLIDALDVDSLLSIVTKETYRNITILLRSQKPSTGYSERTLLKNLGNWLGLMTVARNKPVLYLKLDLKGLLYEAHKLGTECLNMVVPFVALVLKGCAKSEVFRPNNPWTMGLMNVLAELYNEPGHRLNIKFEVEVLCRTLEIDIANLQPTLYLCNEAAAPRRQQLASREPEPQTMADMPVGAGLQGRMPSTPSPALGMLQHPGPPQLGARVDMPQRAQPGAAVTMAPVSAPSSTPQPLDTLDQYQWAELNTHPQQMAASAMPHVRVSEQLELTQLYPALGLPALKQSVAVAIQQALQEVLPSYVERSIKHSITTAECIARKDFALDADETRVQLGAQALGRHLVAGMAHVSARDAFVLTIQTNVKRLCLQLANQQGVNTQSPHFLELLDIASKTIAAENADLCTAFVVKSACEKMQTELNARLKQEYDLRRQARVENRRYCDPHVLTYQAERVPEQIRLKVGGPTLQQMKLYDTMSRAVPGLQVQGSLLGGLSSVPPQPAQQPMHVGSVGAGSPPEQLPLVVAASQSSALPPPRQGASLDEHVALCDRMILELESCVHALMLNAPQQQVLSQSLGNLKEPLVLTRKSPAGVETFTAFLHKVLESLLSSYNPDKVADADSLQRFADCHLMLLRGLRDHKNGGLGWLAKAVAKYLMECREEHRHNVDGVELLVRQRLVHMALYDQHLAESLESGLNYAATTFCMQLVQRFCSEENASATFTEADFNKTIETLTNIVTHSRQAPEGLSTLVQKIRNQHEASFIDSTMGLSDSVLQSGLTQAREYDDPPGLHDKVEFLLREWVTMYHSPSAGRDNTKAFTAIVSQMCQYGILKTDELITRFFRLCTEMCVDLCYRVLAEQHSTASVVRAKCFHTLDAYVRLIALLIKHSGDQANVKTKTNLLNKVLGIVAGILLQDHEIRRTEFQQLPYHRIFIMLFIELNAPEHVLESINMEVLQAFCNVLHILRPSKAPGFAFAWLELISHRVVIARMLAITPQQKGWNMYGQLLIDLFKFLAPFLRNAELTKSLQVLYKGSLRVLLVLLHDFPEFLCDFHYSFCDVLPPNCIQMRNMILSAFPRSMRLPDPFGPNLKVDMLQEVSVPPKVLPNYVQAIQPASFKNDLDSYLSNRAPVSFLSDLAAKLRSVDDAHSRYNVSLVNALVLYVGSQAIKFIQENNHTPSMTTIAHSSHMDIFQNLAVNLDTEGRYLFLNALVNQLRFPNSHTHYFSITLLYLFAEANKEAIQEQITRVLLERLIVNRPHPWGLLITFIDLIKNPAFHFWNHEFVHCAPEIEKLFDNIARSCNQRPGASAAKDMESVAPGSSTLPAPGLSLPSASEKA